MPIRIVLYVIAGVAIGAVALGWLVAISLTAFSSLSFPSSYVYVAALIGGLVGGLIGAVIGKRRQRDNDH